MTAAAILADACRRATNAVRRAGLEPAYATIPAMPRAMENELLSDPTFVIWYELLDMGSSHCIGYWKGWQLREDRHQDERVRFYVKGPTGVARTIRFRGPW